MGVAVVGCLCARRERERHKKLQHFLLHKEINKQVVNGLRTRYSVNVYYFLMCFLLFSDIWFLTILVYQVHGIMAAPLSMKYRNAGYLQSPS